MADRYEPRPLPGQGEGREPQYWGAWDTLHSGWHCYPGTGILAGHPQVFTSSLRVEEWAARQGGSVVTEQAP